jgi:hypothetical protein
MVTKLQFEKEKLDASSKKISVELDACWAQWDRLQNELYGPHLDKLDDDGDNTPSQASHSGPMRPSSDRVDAVDGGHEQGMEAAGTVGPAKKSRADNEERSERCKRAKAS